MSDSNWIHEFHDSGSAIGYEVLEVLHQERSPFQQIDIYRTRTFGTAMALDGCWMVTDRDNFIYHEMMSHPALLSHPAPRDVVIIGGGDCGTLREVARHEDVARIVQIELDERVTRLSEQFFPELCERNDDPRVELRFEDGIRWMEASGPGSADVIIVDCTDPVGPAAGLYDVPFFRTCRETLRPGGILIQQSESPLFHVELLAALRERLPEAGFDAVQHLQFPQPCYPSGWWSATMARRDGQFDVFRNNAANRLATRYFHPEMLAAARTLPRFLAG
ncbi:MAG: polyamine aminopropyltransferase [Pseudomonadota bacterium]